MSSDAGYRRPATLCSFAKQLGARLPDICAAVSEICTEIPIVGERLQPIADVTAMSAWASRQAPDLLRAAAGVRPWPRRRGSRAESPVGSRDVYEGSLRGVVADSGSAHWPQPQRWPPLLQMAEQRRRFLYRSAVSYGDAEAQLLDVWRLPELPATPAPVMIFVPGGAWLHGSRKHQGHALMAHLAAQGWVCLAIDYRVSPRHRWPRHVMDVKAAVAWARAHADQFGGDRQFVAIAGASAGGHLAALTALTPGDPHFDAGLTGRADTRVDAAVSLYGRYDWEDRSTPERERFVGFVEHLIVKQSYRRHRDLYRAASPIARINNQAPPFFVVHGAADTIIPVTQARAFAERLRTHSHAPVAYLEVPGAHHAFDLIDGARTGSVCTAIGLFLNEMHRRRTATLAV